MTVDIKKLKKHTEITDIDFSIEGSHLAVCHELQGYSANGYHTPLVMKSAVDLNSVKSLDLMKALEQVTITMSFEEMLQRFFGMWCEDAAVLAKLLGFETELEAKLSEEDEPNEWELPYMAEALQGIEDKVERFDIIKKAANNKLDELTLDQRKSLYSLESSIQEIVDKDLFIKAAKVGSKASDYAYVPDKETPSSWKLNISDAAHTRAAVAALGKGFRGNKVSIPEADRASVKRKVRDAYKKFFPNNEVPEVIQLSTEPLTFEGVEQPSTISITKNNNEDIVTIATQNNKDGEAKVATKASVDTEMLMKAMEDLKKQNEQLIARAEKADAEKAELIKAQEQERFEKSVSEKGSFILKMGLSDMDQDQQVLLATALVKAENSELIVKAMQALFDRAEAVKAEFGKEVGKDGQLNEKATDAATPDFNEAMKTFFKNQNQKH